MVSQTGTRVVGSSTCKGPVYPEKWPKKSQRAKRKFLGQQALFGTKFLKFGPKRAILATLVCTTSLTTAELRHMHYNNVCDVINKTIFIMSSQWMI